LLQNGATKVYAIDVGHDQLDEKLLKDERVVNMEGTNIRDIDHLDELVDLAVVDLSFISLRLVMENIFKMVKCGGEIVALIKPQFEIGKSKDLKKGVVRDAEIRKSVVSDFFSWCQKSGYQVQNITISPIEGKEGNVEYLFYFKKDGSESMTEEELQGVFEESGEL